MNVLITGKQGFIGNALERALVVRGHRVRRVGRPEIDFMRPVDWRPLLGGIDAVVNAAGLLRGSDEAFRRIHDEGPRELFAACVDLGVRRVVQVSALGADESASSRFHLSKRAADRFLAASALDWAVVQPGLVFGRGGESARLFLGLASAPLILLPGNGRQLVQPVHLDDLVELLQRLVEDAAPVRAMVPAVGPRALALKDYLATLRTQLGLPPARYVEVPLPLLPVDRETLGMLQRGNTAPVLEMERRLGRPARDPAEFVQGEPALAMEARLAWLLPLMRAMLATMWIVSGVVSFGPYPVEASLVMLARAGLTGSIALAALYGAALLDIALGVATLVLRRRRWLWRAQLALIAGYTAIITVAMPELWLHPFGPVLKNLPIAVAILMLHELEPR